MAREIKVERCSDCPYRHNQAMLAKFNVVTIRECHHPKIDPVYGIKFTPPKNRINKSIKTFPRFCPLDKGK